MYKCYVGDNNLALIVTSANFFTEKQFWNEINVLHIHCIVIYT